MISSQSTVRYRITTVLVRQVIIKAHVVTRRVATGVDWGGQSTPIFVQATPEIRANPWSFRIIKRETYEYVKLQS